MKSFQFLFIILILVNFSAATPHLECGTELDLDPQWAAAKKAEFARFLAEDYFPFREIYWAPITFHIVRNEGGTGGLPEHRIDIGLQDLNLYYTDAGIHFYQPGEIDYIDNSEFLTGIDSYDEINLLRQVNVVPNTINIYCVANLSNGNYDLCGISSFTNSEVQGIVMSNNCFATADNHSTLSHEVGHYFDLLHTHSGSGDHDGDGIIDGPNAEFVDGTECELRGDGHCDTPADPDLSEVVSTGCIYTGNYLDGHLEPYDPDTGNLMSYSQKHCRDHFSIEQDAKAVFTLLEYRPELNTPPVDPYIILLDQHFTESQGDGDSILNPGETAQLSLTLSNWEGWPTALNPVLTLETDDPSLTILVDTIFMTELAAGDTVQTQQGFEIQTSADAELGGHNLSLTFSAENAVGDPYQCNFEIMLILGLYQAGWPITEMGDLSLGNVETAPLIFDLVGDPDPEILFGDYQGYVHLLDHWGEPIENTLFPFDAGDQIWGSPAAADLDNDGIVEVILTSKSKHLFILEAATSQVQLDLDLGQFLMGTPALGNLDEDPDLEIIVGGYTTSGRVYALNHDGTAVSGFPVQLDEKIQRGVAVADLDGDGLDDIFCGTDNHHLWLIYGDGSIAPGFPFSADDKFRSAPTILREGDQTILLAGNRDGNFYGINCSGAEQFVINTAESIETASGFSLLNNEPVIVFGSVDGFIYCLTADGQNLAGWPISVGSPVVSAPVSVDLNGDGNFEIITGTEQGEIWVLNHSGESLAPFPIQLDLPLVGSPSVADLDGDGDQEIVLGTSGSLIVIDCKWPAGDTQPWPTHRGGWLRQGTYNAPAPNCPNPVIGDLDCDGLTGILDIVRMVNIIMGTNEYPSNYELWAGDINEDGILDVLDILNLLAVILNAP